ncbi:major facilitator superfamily transporter [Leptolyngbya sp. Heron Island J]|uniref:MFS transporter n=1 Tax=Leptolyngbya sp. Heron Island J TaxID=1385935 RepID=UPI0003B9A604|nr:MFS transporter [Leptolyngbya sp. Heron Island J]ESA37594.1 major facilitator superfamily transporter [Leptolyngbya sp. Heron Island J]
MGTSALVGRRILWLQVLGLAAVQGAISLTWVIYNLYLDDLLLALGFSASLATMLLVIENAMGALMEPLMGSFSDQRQHWVGSRFPQIALGMIASALCFMGIPLVVLGGLSLKLLMPVALVAWALAMTIFRSPALSLLGRYAFESDLPQAASVLTMVGGVTGAMAPIASDFILGLGPLTAFSIGTVVLLLAALVLRQVHPNKTVANSPLSVGANAPMQWANLPWVFMTGVGVASGLRLLLQSFSAAVAATGFSQPKLIMVVLFVTVALSALPCGQLATRLGNRTAMFFGFVGLIVATGVTMMMGSAGVAVVVAIAIGIAFSLVANGTLPYALSMVPASKAGLGTGLYFSGGAVAISVLSGVGANLGLTVSLLIAAISFAVAAGCVVAKQP